MKNNQSYDDAALAVFSRRELPARCDAKGVATILGFPVHAIPVLIRKRKLVPLGKPAANAPKFFATVEVLARALDRDWLDKASELVSENWSGKNKQRRSPQSTCNPSQPQLTQETSEDTLTVCFSGSI